jgi:hypothetical protein
MPPTNCATVIAGSPAREETSLDDDSCDGRYDGPWGGAERAGVRRGRHRAFLDTTDAEDRLTPLVLADGRGRTLTRPLLTPSNADPALVDTRSGGAE